MSIQITEEFAAALDAMNSCRNVLISGKAGTGKSTLLRTYLDQVGDKNVLVTAPTGVAALNVEGFTIHKAFGFRPGMFPEDIDKRGGQWRPSAQVWDVLKKVDVLVVDEVSMVRADLFDMMDRALKRIRHNQQAFGGVQLILVGDLLQLPPVVTQDEQELFDAHCPSPFFFDAHCYSELELEDINLTQVWRQKDPTFLNILNEVREGAVGQESLDLLNECVDEDFEAPNDWVTLTSRKRTVAEINQAQLDRLDSEQFTHTAIRAGEADDSSFSGTDELHYAVGARVMTVINDLQGRFVNGSFGEITRATSTEIDVRLDDTGEIVALQLHTWEIRRPNMEGRHLSSEVVGTITQFPVILAWAITIHKAQGKTIPKCFIYLKGGTTTDGQFYVALSRAVDLENLRFSAPVEPRHIRANNALVRKVRREVATGVDNSRVVFLSFDGVNFRVSEHIARIHTVIYQDGQRVADFGSWINPMADLGKFGEVNNIPAGGLAMAPSLADFWPLLLRQAQGGIVVGDRLAMLERAVRHQERGMQVALGVGYDADDFDVDLSGTVEERCAQLAQAYENGLINPTRGQVVPPADVDAEGAVWVPGWASQSSILLDATHATDSDHAWAAMSGAERHPESVAEVEECAELLAAWAISRGRWSEDMRDEVLNRAAAITNYPISIPAPLNDGPDVHTLLQPGTRVAFTGRNNLLDGPADDERLTEICEARNLEYKKAVSKSRCDVLVAGDISSMSRKAQNARAFGKPIIAQEDFENWWRSEQVPSQTVEANEPALPREPEPVPYDAPSFDDLYDDLEVIEASSLTPGMRVAFRGSVVVEGHLFTHGPQLQALCADLGLEYKQAVTKTRCDVLVSDNLDATDGKTDLARRHNKPVVRTDDFTAWAAQKIAEQVAEANNANEEETVEEPVTPTLTNEDVMASIARPTGSDDSIASDAAGLDADVYDEDFGVALLEKAEELRDPMYPIKQEVKAAPYSPHPFNVDRQTALQQHQVAPYQQPAVPVPQPAHPAQREKSQARKYFNKFGISAFASALLFFGIGIGASTNTDDALIGIVAILWMVVSIVTIYFGVMAAIKTITKK
ncbi:ATP-dependent DNA helicase [Corynebacterium camporealensis]